PTLTGQDRLGMVGRVSGSRASAGHPPHGTARRRHPPRRPPAARTADGAQPDPRTRPPGGAEPPAARRAAARRPAPRPPSAPPSARPAASRRGYPQWTGASGGPFDLRCLQTVAPVACRSDVRPHVGAAARQRNDVVDRCAVRLAPIGRRVDPPLADMTNPVVAFKDFTIGVT